MKKVWTADNQGNAHILKGLLESQGIDAFVQGEQGFARRGVGASMANYPTVWIKNDSQEEAALKTARDFEKDKASEPEGEPWTCKKCGETIEPQFSDCWKCSGS